MSTFNKQKFKQGLLDAGIDLTEEQINNYLNNKLSTEGQIGTITNDVPFAQDLFEQVVNNETANTDETGRANRHNNPGAHIWDMNRERKYGAKKGDPFVGKDSQGNDRTYYTAKYDTIEQGMAASKDVVESHMNAVVNSGVSLNDDNFHEVFARSYTGLSEGQELDNYASRLKSGMQPEGILVGNNLTSDSFTSIDYEKYKTPEERNAALDFLGNALWNALDTGTMGIAGYLDADDSLQKFLEGEEGPSSFAGRAGAGVGGLAGYMVPMSGARALAGKAISSTSKYGVKKFSSKVASEGSEYLAKSAGVKQKGYKGFKTLTKEKQDGFFKEITDDVINKATKARQVKVDESFAKKLASGSDDAISAALKTSQLPNTQKNITAIRGIIEKALLQNGNKSVVPISSLQQRIAMMAGNVPGSAKIANIATHAIEEAFLFAAVETPMEFFQSRNEERDADYVGRGVHSLALGTALGVIKTIPGGKEIIGVDGGASTLSKEIFRKAMRTITGKKPYQSLDVNKISDGKSLKNMVKHQWKGFGNDAPTYFDDALKKTEWRKNNPDKKILTSDHIDELSDTPDGRQALKDILDFSSREWEKRWGPAFMKDAMEDIGGSMKRMILGSMAFNYNVVFDENIPLEDKMFNVLLGAFMSKNHYKSTYIDKDGVVKDLVAGERDMATRLNEANEYLSMLGMKPKDFTFQQLINDANLKSKFFKNAADSEDVQSIVKLLLDNDMLVDANSRISKVAQNKRGQRGDDGLYDALKLLVDGDVLVTENKRMLDPSEITKAKLKKVMKGLSGLNLKDVDVKNIKTPSDLIDIIDHAHDGVWNKFEDLHVKSAASIFNGLSQSSGKVSGVDVQPGKTPTFFEIKVEDSGNLTAPQRRVLDTYNKLLDMLEGRAIKVDRTMPIDINSKHIDDAVINRFEGSNKELDELINGVAGVDQTQSAKLAQEGWTYELFERYAEKRDVRVSYDKLKDLDNPNQFSPLAKPVPGGAQHNGHQIKNLTNDIFIDKSQSYVIYDRINFEGKIPDEQKQFILAYHAYLKQSPEYNIPFLEGQSKTLNIKQGTKKLNDLMDLKKILSEEKITVFLKTGQKLENYLQNYLDYSRHKQLAGVIKTNGKSLNDADRVILSELMDFGLIGKNFEVPEIVGFADEIIKNLEGKANKDFDQFLNEDSVVGSFLKNFSQDVKKEPSDIVKTLKEDWEQFIAPYVKDGQGAGVLKINTRTPAVIDPNEFRALLTFLAEIKVQTNHTSHKDLVNQFEKISNNTGFDKQTRELFQNVYSSLNNPNANIRGVISYMSKNNMYDLIDKEIKFDEKDLTRIEKLREMLNETQLIMDDGEDREIENIVNLYKDKFSKDNDIDVYINESRESIRKAYNFGKDYEFSDKKMDDFIKDGYVEKNGKKYYLDGTDSNPAADGTMSTKERTKYINDITKMLFSNESQRTVLRLTARSAGIDMDSNNRMYDNSLFRTMDHLLTEGPLTKGDTGFAIIDTKFADGNKSINTRGTRDFEVQARRDLLDAFDGKNNKEMIDKSYDSTEDGYLKYETTPGYVVIGVGDLTFDIGIRRDKLPVLAKKLDDLLKDNENTYKDAKYAESHKTLRKLFKKTFNKIKGEGDDEFIYEFKKSQNRAESQALEVLVTHAMMNGVNINGKKTGLQNHWWDHLALTHGKSEGMEVLKKARRMTLLANVSMKELNSNHLDNVINLTNKFGGKLDKDALEALKTIKTNGGLRMLIMEDEDFSKIGTSINRDLQEQIGLAAAKTPEGTTLKGTRPNKGEIDYANGGDISAVDSYTAVSPKIMKGLYKLVGAGNIEGLGGLKPIIHRLGNKIIIGKTAFISDPKITRFLKKNNQDMVMFGSAAKIHYDKSKFIKDWGSLNDLANLRLSPEDLKKTELIGIDEISLGAVVNSDKGASIPYQGFKDISLNQSKEVYDWLISNKLEEYNTSFGDFTNPKNNDGIAFAKMLMQNRTTDNANSLTERLLLNDLNPLSTLVKDDFVNMIKNQYLDKSGIFTPKTDYGVQSVTSPGTNQKFTLFDVEGKVYQYGQVELPANAGLRNINLDNLHLIKRNESGYDEVILAKDLLGKKLKQTSGRELLLNIKSTDKLSDVVNRLKNTEYEVATVVRRNPSTRPGDMVVLGIKDILFKEYGNTTKVNASDFAYRLEGDHDVDKVDAFWDTPPNTLKKWIDLSGEVDRVIPDGADKKSTLRKNNFDWLTPGSMNKYRENIETSMKYRGITVKAQRLLQGMSEYSNTELKDALVDADGNAVKGIVLDLAQGKGGMLHIDPVLLKEAKKQLAKDIQDITDAATGFDENRFNDDWEKTFLFGDNNPTSPYQGIFRRAEWDSKTNKYVTNNTTYRATKLHQEMILEAMRPYKTMLQLGTNVYSQGKAQKVRYNDIIENIKMYDREMFSTNMRVYFKVKKKFGNQENAINAMFLNRQGLIAIDNNKSLQPRHFKDVFGGFQNSLRPNLSQGGTNIANLLPFEQSMSFIAAKDKSNISLERKLYGAREEKFDKFFEDTLYDEDIPNITNKFVKLLESDNRFYGYLGNLDNRIAKLKSILYNVERSGNINSAQYYQGLIDNIEIKKKAIEEKIASKELDVAPGQVKGAVGKLTEKAKQEIVQDMLNGRMPQDFTKITNVDLPNMDKKSIRAWAKSKESQRALFTYVKSKGIIRFKGMRNTDYIDLFAAEQSMALVRNLNFDSQVSKNAQQHINDEIMAFKKFYGKSWIGVLSGKDAHHDNIKLSSEIMHRLDEIYFKLEQDVSSGAGKKFIYDLMIPKRQDLTFTYVSAGKKGKLLPAYKDESLKYYKLGLKWMNKTKLLDEDAEKQYIFETIAKSHNTVWDAFFGKQRINFLEDEVMKQNIQEAMEIMTASPLLDDLSKYNMIGGIQQQFINPEVQFAMGASDNQSISYLLNNRSILPQDIKILAESSIMPFGPKAYLDPSRYAGDQHPGIHGIKSYQYASNGAAMAWLGDSRKQNLVYDDTGKNYNNDLPTLTGEGRQAVKSKWQSKVNCEG